MKTFLFIVEKLFNFEKNIFNMKTIRIICSFTLVTMMTAVSNAQESIFSQTIGLGYNSYYSASSLGVIYAPRVRLFYVGKEANISIGTHLSGGYAWHSFEPKKTYFYEAPLVLECNFGKGSEPSTRSKTGGFVGIGYGINRNGSEKAWGNDSFNADGIVFTFGVRRIVKDIPLGIRMQYLYNLEESEYSIWGFGLHYFLGELD